MDMIKIAGKYYKPEVSSLNKYCKKVYGKEYFTIKISIEGIIYMKILPEDVGEFGEDVDADTIYTFNIEEGIIEEIGEGISIEESYVFYSPVNSKVLLNNKWPILGWGLIVS